MHQTVEQDSTYENVWVEIHVHFNTKKLQLEMYIFSKLLIFL